MRGDFCLRAGNVFQISILIQFCFFPRCQSPLMKKSCHCRVFPSSTLINFWDAYLGFFELWLLNWKDFKFGGHFTGPTRIWSGDFISQKFGRIRVSLKIVPGYDRFHFRASEAPVVFINLSRPLAYVFSSAAHFHLKCLVWWFGRSIAVSTSLFLYFLSLNSL